MNAHGKNRSALRSLALLYLEDPLGERVSSAELNVALDEAQLEYALRTGAVRDTFELSLVADQWEYDVKEEIASAAGHRGYVEPLRLGVEDDEIPPLPPTAQRVLDVERWTWDQKTSVVFGWTRDLVPPNHLAVVGIPQEAQVVTLAYCAQPVVMATDAEYPDPCIKPEMHEAIAHGAAAALLLESSDKRKVELSAVHRARFEQLCAAGRRGEHRARTPYSGGQPL